MKATFEVIQIIQPWGPPFTKQIQEKTFCVSENESFDVLPKRSEPIFKLLKTQENKVLIRYHSAFTLKGYVQPQNKEIWLSKGESKEFSHQWGDNGFTKKITFKGLDMSAQTEATSQTKNTALQTEPATATVTATAAPNEPVASSADKNKTYVPPPVF